MWAKSNYLNKIHNVNNTKKLIKKNTLSPKDLETNNEKLIRTIREKLLFNENNICTNAFKVATDPETLRAAYETIKSKPGNMVRGVDSETLDGLPIK